LHGVHPGLKACCVLNIFSGHGLLNFPPEEISDHQKKKYTTTHLRPEEMADCFGTNGTDCPARCGWLKDVPRQHMWWAKAEP